MGYFGFRTPSRFSNFHDIFLFHKSHGHATVLSLTRQKATKWRPLDSTGFQTERCNSIRVHVCKTQHRDDMKYQAIKS